MVITVLDHVPHCYSSDDGFVIYRLLRPALSHGEHVSLSFAGVQDVPSSVINAALVPFLQQYGSRWLRDHLEIVGATRQVADMIRHCFGNAQRALEAA